MNLIENISAYWQILVAAGWVLAAIKFVPRLYRWMVNVANADWALQKCRAREAIMEREIANLLADLNRAGGGENYFVSRTNPTTPTSTPSSSPSEQPGETSTSPLG
jgi:hypothetical protein